MKTIAALLLAVLANLLTSGFAAAQYPARPIRLVVPFPAGGPTDGVARSVAQAMSKSLGQPIFIENKPGADGAIAAQAVVGAAPDGYTLLFATTPVMALAYVARPAPFDAADLVPVSTVGRFPFGMFVHAGIPSQSMTEFIGYARANPGKLNFGSTNVAEQMASTQFIRATGADMVAVSYKGSAQVMPDLIAGRIQVYFGPVGSGLQHVKAGKLRLLAIASPRRLTSAPEFPTMSEAGVEGVAVETYQMFVAPAKTPRDVIDRLAHEVNAVLKDPEVRVQLESRALAIEGSTPEALAAINQATGLDWANFLRRNGAGAQ